MRQFLDQIKEVWKRLPMTGRIATVSATVATLALMSAIVYYGTQSEYGVLFSDLKPADAQTIVEKLKSSGIPYNLTNGGTTIQVPVERISELRLEMASSGVISGGHVGFDLFDKTSFGATDFAQQVNYRRAIEGELARTLEGMDEVEAARVHFTPKRESIFTEKEEGAKSSVMLRVRQGKELSQERTEAIVNLVASSIEGLDPSSVSVMDTRGRLLTAAGRNKSGRGGGDAGTFNAQLDSKRKYETETAARVTSLLEPIVGVNGVRADVAADVDFSQIEQTEEKFDPQSQVVRSQKTAELKKNTQSTRPAQVAVGARANDPTAPPPNNGQNQQIGNDERVQTTTNYEIDKTVRRTVGGSGRVNRLTVSVVVDHKTVNDTQVARTAAELQQIESLVAAAVGIDENRGDSVVVQTMPFAKSQSELASPAFSWFENNKRLISTATKYGMLALVAFLILFFVVRPAKRYLKLAIAGNEGDVKQLEAGEEAADTEEETAETDEKRLTEGETKITEENILPEGEIGMTVSEIEAQMNGEKPEPEKVSAEIETEEEISQTESAKRSLESVRQILLDDEAEEAEIVVGTLRGWLRE